MAAEDILAEALCRLEYKMDYLFRAVSSLAPTEKVLPMVSPGDTCPFCSKIVEYQVNVNKNVVSRKCGCKTGKIVPDLNQFLPPAAGNIGGSSGHQELEGQEVEDSHRSRRG